MTSSGFSVTPAYVQAACKRARVLKGEPKAARIARQTGLALDEVRRWMRQPLRPESAPRRARSQAERVLWRWWTEPALRDRFNCHPAVLPMTGGDRSFEGWSGIALGRLARLAGSAGCIDVGGGIFGNDKLLNDLLRDPDGRIPLLVR